MKKTVATVQVLETLWFSSSRDGDLVRLPEDAHGKIVLHSVAVAMGVLGEGVVLHPCSVSSCVPAVHR